MNLVCEFASLVDLEAAFGLKQGNKLHRPAVSEGHKKRKVLPQIANVEGVLRSYARDSHPSGEDNGGGD